MKRKSEVQAVTNNAYIQKVNVEEIFENAIDMANKQFKLKAIEIAREALIFAKKSNDYLSVYIHGFLAVLHMELHKTSTARIHVYSALNILNKEHYSYQTDTEYFNALLHKLNRIDAQNSEVRESIAA